MQNRESFLWVEKYRPKEISECILPDHIKEIFQGIKDQGRIPNMILSGGPGTGKTTTLLNKLDRLFARGVKPYQIAYLSFTNKAVNEAKQRAANKFTDISEEDLRNFRTIHSFCRQNFKTKPLKPKLRHKKSGFKAFKL